MKKLKLILKNMLSEKWRILLNILAVAIAGSIFYISFIISTTLTDTYTVINRNTAGNSDIQISKDDSYQSVKDDLESDGYENVVEEIFISGVYRNDSMTYWYNVHCFNPYEINKISDVKIEKDYSDFTGNEAIIGQAMADMFELSIGDEIELSLNGVKSSFEIYDIAEESGFFSKEVTCEAIILPLDTVRDLMGDEESVTNTYITLNANQDIDECLLELQDSFPDFNCSKTVDEEEIRDNYSMYTQIFLVVAVIVLFMSIYIIYANFKTLSYDRIEFLGVIRSIGVSRKKSLCYLVSESALTGFIGGILSIGIGILLQYVIQRVLLGFQMKLSIKIPAIVLVMVLTVLISIIGALSPIMKVSKISTAEIIKGDWTGNEKKINIPVTLIGFILILVVLIMFRGDSMSPPLLAAGILGMVIGIAMIMNAAVFILEKILTTIIQILLGNRGKKITLLLLGDDEYRGIIRFCAFCAAVVLMIASVAAGIKDLSKDAFKVYNSDIVMSTDGMDKEFIEELKQIDGVDEVYATYELWNVGVDDDVTSIQMLDSAGSKAHEDFFNYTGELADANYYDRLSEGKNIIISKSLARKLKKGVGDKVTLHFEKKSDEFTITDIIEFNINTGMYAVISEQNVIQDAGSTDYDRVYVKTESDPDTVIKRINDYFEDQDLWIVSTEQRLQDSLSSLNQIFIVIYMFIFICSIVGIIGIINSMAVSFYKRKKEWGIMMTLGMSRRESQICLLIEVLFIGIISGILGGLLGLLLIQIIPAVFEVVNYPVVRLTISSLYILLGIIFMTIVIAIPALGNIHRLKKLDVVSNLKEN